MKGGFKLLTLMAFIFLNLMSPAKAELAKYVYPYDISELDWQLLKWTAAWHDTKTPCAPFTLDYLEYNRKQRTIEVYLKGLIQEGTPENLKESMKTVATFISSRFSYFKPEKDLIIHYALSSEDKSKSIYIEYKEGNFIFPE